MEEVDGANFEFVWVKQKAWLVDPNLIYWGFNAGYHKDDRAGVYVRECRKLGWGRLGWCGILKISKITVNIAPVYRLQAIFPLPEWLFLTNKSGILNALAANYAPELKGKTNCSGFLSAKQ